MLKKWAVAASMIVCFTLLSASIIGASPAQATPVPAPKAGPSHPLRGVAFSLSGRLPTHVSRPVELQQKVGSSWKSIAWKKTNSKGRYVFSTSAKTSSAQFRVVASKIRIGKKTYSRIISKTTKLRTVSVSPSSPVKNEHFTVSDSLRREGVRRVILQRKSGHRWVKVASAKTDATGAFTIHATLSKSATLRVFAPKATINKKRRAAVTLKTFKVSLAAQRGSMALVSAAATGQALAFKTTFTPARAGRVVQLQTLRGTQWQTLTSATEDATGVATLAITPTAAGTFTYRAVAVASAGAAAVATPATVVTVALGVSRLSIMVDTPAQATIGEDFYAVVVVAGGRAPYTWSATGLPPGVTMGSDGKLVGKPTTPGTYATHLSALDTDGRTASADLTIVVTAAVAIAFDNLPTALAGDDYQASLSARDGTSPYRWSATGLPSGFTLDEDGTLSGSTTTTGTYQVTLTVTDARSKTATKTVGFVVTEPLAVSTTSLPAGSLNQAYRQELIASGGQAPYSWSADGLPTGLTVSDDGILSGTPTASGDFDAVTVTVTDATGASATHTFTLTISSVTITALSGGDIHSCAVTSEGEVRCWGRNNYGQLGNGTLVDSITPVSVSGLDGGAVAVANGNGFSCALTTSGAVKCWGYNSNGQLGNNDSSNTSRTVPVDVVGLASGVAAITAGGKHACAITTAGAAWCWGGGAKGQLGYGSTIDRKYAVSVTGFASDVSAISAGNEHTCAVKSGAVWCWGSNSAGQVGAATTMTFASSPRAIATLSSGISTVMAAGSHSCALTATGGVSCWGSNVYGELGDGTTVNSYTPVEVAGLTSGVANISGGASHTCARTSAGAVSCWGRNDLGQLGNTSQTDATTPVTVNTLTSGVTLLSSGLNHSCAATASEIKCWGSDDYGQLGDGGGYLQPLSEDAAGISDAVELSASDYAMCALTTDGAVTCWGQNNYGQLGNGTTTNSSTPVAVSGLTSGVTALAGGTSHFCALTTDGAVACWGQNNYGQLGNGTTTNSSTPVAVAGLTSGVTAISSSANHTCAITAAATMVCWGSNGYSQLGDGTTTNATVPVTVAGLSDVSAIAAGSFHTCAVVAGSAKCWGSNGSGGLGDGTTTNRTVPTDVTDLPTGTITSLEAGNGYTCAIVDGVLHCWGNNSNGQLGIGTYTNSLTPQRTTGMDDTDSAVSASVSNTCALSSTGVVRCWGHNLYGAVGDGTITTRSTPTVVIGLGTATSVQTGRNFACAATTTGAVQCWGYNNYGQLGRQTLSANTPVTVAWPSR